MSGRGRPRGSVSHSGSEVYDVIDIPTGAAGQLTLVLAGVSGTLLYLGYGAATKLDTDAGVVLALLAALGVIINSIVYHSVFG